MVTPESTGAIQVQQDGAHITITVRAATRPADELVPLTRESLEKRDLEHRPIVRLAEAGTLRTVWIGRRRYTRLSWLLELASTLPAATASEPTDDLAVAASKRAARRAK